MCISHITLECDVSPVAAHSGVRLSVEVLITARICPCKPIGIFAVIIGVDAYDHDFVLIEVPVA